MCGSSSVVERFKGISWCYRFCDLALIKLLFFWR